jgi:hypothetical protein
VETRDAARRWRERWEAGWRALEPARIVELYRPDAHFVSHPFRPPEPARVYIERALAEEEAAGCEFSEPIVDGDRAAIEWRAQTRLRGGGTERLAGVSLVRFDGDGLVVEQRDFWALG